MVPRCEGLRDHFPSLPEYWAGWRAVEDALITSINTQMYDSRRHWSPSSITRIRSPTWGFGPAWLMRPRPSGETGTAVARAACDSTPSPESDRKYLHSARMQSNVLAVQLHDSEAGQRHAPRCMLSRRTLNPLDTNTVLWYCD